MKHGIRKIENFHILLWLLKDLCWVTLSKSLGIFMIIPTLALAIYITIINREDKSEFAHNMAICFWICANSVWMIGEFYYKDETRTYAIVFFIAGLFMMLRYYILAVFNQTKIKGQ
jgi:hypothetical protein